MSNFKAVKAMHETMAFDRAIERALELINFEETLVIVTADHSHVMTMAGYPSRGTDIRGRLIKPVLIRFQHCSIVLSKIIVYLKSRT